MKGFVRRLSQVGSGLTYRDVEVVSFGEYPEGPVLIVANHFGGLADAMLLISLSPRFPRIVARDVIWRVPVAKQLMTGIAAIPVHKRSDKASTGSRSTNDEMYQSCYRALGEGSSVLIFPEGVTQEDPHIAPVKPGAARIALGASANGVSNLSILPVGIHYEDKATFRSRVLVIFGEPIDLSEVMPALDGQDAPLDASNRPAVSSLTRLIDDGLRTVAPDFQDWEEARDLVFASDVALRQAAPPAEAVQDAPLALTNMLAARLARRPDSVDAVRSAATAYRQDIEDAGYTDYQVLAPAPRGRRLTRRIAGLLAVLVLIPYAVVGALLGVIPYLLMQLPRVIPVGAAVKATAIPALALLVFLGEWVLVTVLAGNAWGWGLAGVVALLAPAFLGAAVWVSEQLVLVVRRAAGWLTRRSRRSELSECRTSRAATVAAVREAL